MSVLEISKGLPKSKRLCPPKWMEDNCEGIKLTITAEMMECHPGQRDAPSRTLRPIKDDGTVAKVRQKLPLNVVMPNRAVRINE